MPIAARLPNTEFREIVKNDKRIARMHDFERAGDYTLPTRKLSQELLNLQASRKFPPLSPHTILAEAQIKVVGWSHESTAIFSRANSIRMQAFVKKRRLDEHIRVCRNHLAEEYQVYLKRITTVKGQEKAVKDALEHFSTISYNLESLIQLADMLIFELDKTGYGVNNTLEAAKLSSRPERNI